MCVVCVLSWAGSGQWPQVDGEKPPVGPSMCSITCSMLWTGERVDGKAEGGRAAGQEPLVLVGLEAPSQGRGDFSRQRQGAPKTLPLLHPLLSLPSSPQLCWILVKVSFQPPCASLAMCVRVAAGDTGCSGMPLGQV